MLSRRQFLKLSAIAGASVAVPWKLLSDASPAYAFSQSGNLKKFIQPLRKVGADIPIAVPDTNFRGWWQKGVTHYTIGLGQFEDQLHPDLPNPTRLWGYGQNGIFKHLGGVIVAKEGAPVQVTWQNNLPAAGIVPVDRSSFFEDAQQYPDNRAAVHVHGAFIQWVSDGGPMAWWDPTGLHGPSFLDVLNPHPAANEAEYYIPNQQTARLMWYHDHAHDITRINAYAGLATGYVIYDDYELSLVANNNLPGPLDPRTHYLIFQDKIFVADNTASQDPTWFDVMPNSRPGDMWYAHVYDTGRYGALGPNPAGTPPDPSCVPEYFGDTMLVNGSVFPTLTVEQRQYRFRMLNACNARFVNPRLVYARGTSFPDSTEPNPTKAGPAFVQIGTEGGFLPAPAMVNGPKQPLLLVAPAERADLIVDFRDVPAGSILILYSDAPAPFPVGDPRNDYYPGNPKTPTSIPGYGPNTRTLLQIKVVARSGPADPPITLPASFVPGITPLLVQQAPGVPTANPSGVPVRYLTLNETFDDWGRLIQMLGTNQAVNPGNKGLLFGRPFMDAPTEIVSAGSTEVWEIANLTGDVHPIHFHLVNGQVLSRQAFSVSQYNSGSLSYQGPVMAPDDNELGWKETVRMYPGTVTRMLFRFDLPSVPFKVPASPRTGGSEFVWHCHILEHEEHDMMRPLVVT
jgi:spore coat protein A